MGRVSKTSIASCGTPIRCRVPVPVHAAMLAEATRLRRSVDHVAGLLLGYWYEDVYLPTQQTKKKPPTP